MVYLKKRPYIVREPSPTGKAIALKDIELVDRFKKGDETAFDQIVSNHKEKMYLTALSILHNSADAEEIAQDVFIRAYRNLKDFRGDSSLLTWLYRIATNQARNRYWFYFRRQMSQTMSLDRPLNEGTRATFAEHIADEGPDAAHAASLAEFVALVDECMLKLFPGQREVLTLRNRLYHSYEEISDIMGIPIGTVKSRLKRARDALREHMVGSCTGLMADGDLKTSVARTRTNISSYLKAS